MCVPDVVKNINIKIFNLMSRKARHAKWNETCKCKFRLDANVWDNKQRRNKEKYRCECKEFIDKEICDKWFIWNSSNCECKCEKLCDFEEYLDYANCKWRKKLVNKLVEECTGNIDKVKIDEIALFKRENECKSSCTIYIVLTAIVFRISIEIGTYLIYYKYMNHDKKLLLNTIMSMFFRWYDQY